jgi:hypothetical protein
MVVAVAAAGAAMLAVVTLAIGRGQLVAVI